MKKIYLQIFTLLLIFTISIRPTYLVKAHELELITAPIAYTCDESGKLVIFAKNENERRPIASMTKIMLLLLAFEENAKGNLNFEEEIIVSQQASSMGGSQVFLQANEKYKVSNLIKSIIIASANDASVAIAEQLYGSEENAVTKMNERAKELNLTNTLFANCTGLPKATQFSSAKDVAIMFSQLIKHTKYYEFSKIYLDELVHPDGQRTTLTNTNKLIRFYDGCDGGKTGFTNEAGFCLVATAKRAGMRIISVIINEKDSKTRFQDCSKLFDYSFENFVSKTVLDQTKPYEVKAKVAHGKNEFVEVVAQKDFSIIGKRNSKDQIEIELISNNLKAPVKKGEVIGIFKVYNNGVLVGQINALANETVLRESILDIVKKIVTN